MKSAKETERKHADLKTGKAPAPASPDSELQEPEVQEAAEATAGAAVEEAAAPVDIRFLRLQADFDNFRKRTLREKEDLYRRANEDLMEELLPVLDHLELAVASVADKNDPIAKGFQLVAEQLVAVLMKFGLSPIETNGVAFDPNIHEAMVHMPSPDVPENGIISKTRAGYKLGRLLLRAAQVVVSSGPPEDKVQA